MKIDENASLKPFNTFGLDVRARVLAQYDSADELRALIEGGLLGGSRVIHVGRGSNLLFVNDFFDGVVLHSRIGGFEIGSDATVTAGAGMTFDDLVEATVNAGLSGLENLSLIPGEVGAAAVQNIGAYGVEAADRIVCVNTVDMTDGSARRFEVSECGYGYRDSIFKHPDFKHYAVTSVTFRLDRNFTPVLTYRGLAEAMEGRELTPRAVRDAVIDLRRSKLPDPDKLGNGGSFFKNPVVPAAKARELQKEYPAMPSWLVGNDAVKLSAGWLIEQCGWKGHSLGRAGVYGRQALVLVNLGGATGREIAALAEAVTSDVYERFGVRLSPEVNFL